MHDTLAPELPVGTPVLVLPSPWQPTPQPGFVRQWPDGTLDLVKQQFVPVFVVGDATEHAINPAYLVALP